jgi:hypothetical protein
MSSISQQQGTRTRWPLPTCPSRGRIAFPQWRWTTRTRHEEDPRRGTGCGWHDHFSYDIETQVRSVFQNVKWILEDAGSSWEKIVDVTVYLTNMKDDFATYNRLWKEYFEKDPPCRTTLGDQLPAHTDRDRVEGGGDGVISVDQRAARSTSRPISGRP